MTKFASAERTPPEIL